MTSTQCLRNIDLSPHDGHEVAHDLLRRNFLEEQEALLSRELALEERLFWLETIINSVPASLYVKDAQGRFIFGNQATFKSHALELPDTLIGKTDFDLHAPAVAQQFFDLEQEVLKSGKSLIGIEQEIMTADGRSRSMLVSKIPIHNEANRPAGIVGLSYDISDRKEAETLMLGHANMFGMLARAAPLEEIVSSIILLVEEQLPGAIGSLQMLSPDGLHLFEPIAPNLPYSYRTLLAGVPIGPVGSCSGTAVWSGAVVIIDDMLTATLMPGLAETAITVGIRSAWSSPVLSYKGETLGAFSVYTSTVATPDSSQSDLIAMASYMLGIAIERKHSEERIQFLAHHDALTGLANRSLFHERLTSSVKEAQGNRARITLAFLDLDNFKLINDTLGHDAGDLLLKTIAERATACSRKTDIVARLGGDEFVILLVDHLSESEPRHDRLYDLQKAVSAPVTLSGRSLQITFSMGVACFPEHGETPASLLTNADLAMYRAKAAGRNNIQIFSPWMADASNTSMLRRQQLRDAIDNDQFIVHYQPQIDVVTGRVFALEALVRWNHPDLGLVAPADFIPFAEETGLIVPLGDWVLRHACRQNKAWQNAGLEPRLVSVNVSARQFSQKGWANHVAAILQETGLEPRYLELELAESLLVQDLERANATLDELDRLGVRLAVDHFGLGYSSLSALKGFPVDRLKIDRSFVRYIPASEDDMAIIAAIISLAQKLHLQVTAKGIETQAQADFFRECGCNALQGYFFGRPATAQQCGILMASNMMNGDIPSTEDRIDSGGALESGPQ